MSKTRQNGYFRFNRYMVECESVYRTSTFADNKSFNRYMVECESTFLLIALILYRGFNRYMVECE